MSNRRSIRQPITHPWKRIPAREVHKSPDGRLWVMLKDHPQTDDTVVVCRSYERGMLHHTAIWPRTSLKPAGVKS